MAGDTTCACKDCDCNVPADKAVMKDGKTFCCEECAAGHPNHEGCGHDHCKCHG